MLRLLVALALVASALAGPAPACPTGDAFTVYGVHVRSFIGGGGAYVYSINADKINGTWSTPVTIMDLPAWLGERFDGLAYSSTKDMIYVAIQAYGASKASLYSMHPTNMDLLPLGELATGGVWGATAADNQYWYVNSKSEVRVKSLEGSMSDKFVARLPRTLPGARATTVIYYQDGDIAVDVSTSKLYISATAMTGKGRYISRLLLSYELGSGKLTIEQQGMWVSKKGPTPFGPASNLGPIAVTPQGTLISQHPFSGKYYTVTKVNNKMTVGTMEVADKFPYVATDIATKTC